MTNGRAEDRPIDFAFVNVTPPNSKGFVSFGPHQWNKRMYARRARHAIAEVDANMTRTYGDVYMHVSEFEYFVEGTPPPPDLNVIEQSLAAMDAEKREGIRAVIAEVGVERIWPIVQYLQRIKCRICACCSVSRRRRLSSRRSPGYLSELIEDGVTIQIGVGDPSSQMPRMGAFDGKHDLGLHTEMCAPGIARLVDAGNNQRAAQDDPSRKGGGGRDGRARILTTCG